MVAVRVLGVTQRGLALVAFGGPWLVVRLLKQATLRSGFDSVHGFIPPMRGFRTFNVLILCPPVQGVRVAPERQIAR